MFDSSSSVIPILIGVVGVAVVVVVLAFAVQFMRVRSGHFGPGHHSVPAPASYWRRYVAGLWAPYTAAEAKAGAFDSANPLGADQRYFGYTYAGPLKSLPKRLRKSYGVANADAVKATLDADLNTVIAGAGAVRRQFGLEIDAAQRRMAQLGVPPEAAQRIVRGLAHPELQLPSDPVALASSIADSASLTRLAAAAKWITPAEADSYGDVLGGAALIVFNSWQQYGDDFESGYRARGGNGRPMFKGLEFLRQHSASPWQRLPWPGSIR